MSVLQPPGETVAFIGSTGSGKSTLIQLIPRFYDVSEGKILIDGVDVRDYRLSKLRDKIGFIPQKRCYLLERLQIICDTGKKMLRKKKWNVQLRLLKLQNSFLENQMDLMNIYQKVVPIFQVDKTTIGNSQSHHTPSGNLYFLMTAFLH